MYKTNVQLLDDIDVETLIVELHRVKSVARLVLTLSPPVRPQEPICRQFPPLTGERPAPESTPIFRHVRGNVEGYGRG